MYFWGGPPETRHISKYRVGFVTFDILSGENRIRVWRNGAIIFTFLNTIDGDFLRYHGVQFQGKIGFGARTGGKNNDHEVRNMKVYISTENGKIIN